MINSKNDIAETLSKINNLLIDNEGESYAIGYMETLMDQILTAFVPARDRYRMLDVIKARIEDLQNEKDK